MTGSRSTARWIAALAAALGASLAATQGPPDKSHVAASSERLAQAHAVQVAHRTLDLGPAHLVIDHGILVPVVSKAGATGELVFIGSARFTLDDLPSVEASQLRMFTGAERMNETISEGVLVLFSADALRRLTEGTAVGAGEETEALERAAARFERWQRSTERRSLAVDARSAQAAHGDRFAQEFVAAWCASSRFEFVFQHDPRHNEPDSLGRFVPDEMSEQEIEDAEKHIRREQRHGRYRDLLLEDVGRWDIWVSTGAGHHPYEPVRYSLDAAIADDLQWLQGRTRVEIEIREEGVRAILFAMHPDLSVSKVADASGAELEFRGASRVSVFLPVAPKIGDIVKLEIDYGGPALYSTATNVTRHRSPTHWYPRCWNDDRATYKATLRFPKNMQLVGSGRVVDSGEEGGRAWQKRVLDTSVGGFSFEIGKYETESEQVGGLAVAVHFLRHADYDVRAAHRREVLTVVRDALRFYEAKFGALPVKELTVVCVPERGFSQGLLGFLTIDYREILFSQGVDVGDSRRRVIAHELAHQWWGNKVGWKSDRDLWLSEAIAEFSAYAFDLSRPDKGTVSLAQWSWERKVALTRSAAGGRPPESLGPIVLGSRLDSSFDSGFAPVVYDKGALVLSLFSRLFGTDAFVSMLGAVSANWDGQLLETDAFLGALGRLSGRDLSAYAQRFVYGTGLPVFFYEYDVSGAEPGPWTIHVRIQERAPSRPRFALERDDQERWHLRRTFEAVTPPPPTEWPLPFQILADEPGEEGESGATARADTRSRPGFGGMKRVRFDDGTARMEVRVDQKPLMFWIDQRGELPAFFYCRTRSPKDTLRIEARILASGGASSEAEKLLRHALRAPMVDASTIKATGKPADAKLRSALLDAQIRLDLAELLRADLAREAEARQEMKAADALIPARPGRSLMGIARPRPRSDERAPAFSESDTLAAYMATPDRNAIFSGMLAFDRGDADAAYDSLSKVLFLPLAHRWEESVSDRARREKFAEGWHLSPAAYAMFAASAHAHGDEHLCGAAAREAEWLGVDISELRKLH